VQKTRKHADTARLAPTCRCRIAGLLRISRADIQVTELMRRSTTLDTKRSIGVRNVDLDTVPGGSPTRRMPAVRAARGRGRCAYSPTAGSLRQPPHALRPGQNGSQHPPSACAGDPGHTSLTGMCSCVGCQPSGVCHGEGAGAGAEHSTSECLVVVPFSVLASRLVGVPYGGRLFLTLSEYCGANGCRRGRLSSRS
jgi:hypothetical protein